MEFTFLHVIVVDSVMGLSSLDVLRLQVHNGTCILRREEARRLVPSPRAGGQRGASPSSLAGPSPTSLVSSTSTGCERVAQSRNASSGTCVTLRHRHNRKASFMAQHLEVRSSPQEADEERPDAAKPTAQDHDAQWGQLEPCCSPKGIGSMLRKAMDATRIPRMVRMSRSALLNPP